MTNKTHIVYNLHPKLVITHEVVLKKTIHTMTTSKKFAFNTKYLIIWGTKEKCLLLFRS